MINDIEHVIPVCPICYDEDCSFGCGCSCHTFSGTPPPELIAAFKELLEELEKRGELDPEKDAPLIRQVERLEKGW